MSELNEMKSIAKNLQRVRDLISAAHQRGGRKDPLPRLVAVSKTKSKSAIIEAYHDGDQRHFGENYVQELIDKANDSELITNCPDLKWHFIGTVQSNKVAKIVSIPQLYMVETLSSEKSAKLFNQHFHSVGGAQLPVMIQVNTSGEEQKGGVDPEESVKLAKFVNLNCPRLEFRGFMTIGSLDSSRAEERPNPDFLKLMEVRQNYCDQTGKPSELVELSMGMSSDFELAVEMGSTNVRLGSTIFGSR